MEGGAGRLGRLVRCEVYEGGIAVSDYFFLLGSGLRRLSNITRGRSTLPAILEALPINEDHADELVQSALVMYDTQAVRLLLIHAPPRHSTVPSSLSRQWKAPGNGTCGSPPTPLTYSTNSANWTTPTRYRTYPLSINLGNIILIRLLLSTGVSRCEPTS